MAEDASVPRESARPQRRYAAPEEIARRARALWEQYGRPAGRDEQIWLEAERQLRGLDLSDPAVTSRFGRPPAAAAGGAAAGPSREVPPPAARSA